MEARPTAQQRRLRARMVQRAIETDAPLLAAALHRQAEASGGSWEQLAQSLGCSVDDLNGIALCRLPRPERFAEDVRAIAGERVDAERLAELLYSQVFPHQGAAHAAEARAEYVLPPSSTAPDEDDRPGTEGQVP